MLAPEPLRGQRVVAEPGAIDALVAGLPVGATVLRIAPDEALVVDAAVRVDDPHGIVEDETGFVALVVEREVLARHVEWPLPPADGFAQGAVAGVPAKVAGRPDGRALVVTPSAYLADLLDRLR